MSAEFDFTPGLDFSSLSSVTQEQILQAIAQLRTLSNKGLVIIGSTTPDVVNNPRYAGYVWLDNTTQPPIVKTYNTDTLAWASTPVAAISVTTAMMAAVGATGGINIGLLKRAADGSADASKGTYIVRIDSAGQYCEIVSLDTALSGISGGIGLNRISVAGAGVGYYLGYDGAALAWKKLAPATDFTAALTTQIPVTCLSPGTATYILRTNAAGTAVEWIATTSDSLFAAATITLDKLGNNSSSGGVATAYQVPQRNSANTATEWNTPILAYKSAALAITMNSKPLNDVAHGLGGIPDVVHAYLRCTTNDNGWVIGDCIDIDNIIGESASEENVGIQINFSATVIGARVANVTQLLIAAKAANYTPAALTVGSWVLVVQAFKFNTANVN